MGGFFAKHHDCYFESDQTARAGTIGPRIFTLLVRNVVERGGATRFFHLGVNVHPNDIPRDMFPEKPTEKDERTGYNALISRVYPYCTTSKPTRRTSIAYELGSSIKLVLFIFYEYM